LAKTPAPTAASRDEQKQAALAMAIGQIEKAYGKGSVMYRDNIARLPVSVISTGAIASRPCAWRRRSAARTNHGDLRR